MRIVIVGYYGLRVKGIGKNVEIRVSMYHSGFINVSSCNQYAIALRPGLSTALPLIR